MTESKADIKDDDFKTPHTFVTRETNQNRKSWKNLARATERFNISNRAGASIANAVMKDLGIITDENDKLVVDK